MNEGTERALVEQVFLDALERPPEERARFLDDACGTAPALRAEVESLLEAAGAGLLPDLEEPQAFQGRFPERIGPYRIVRPLGEGGMGVVLLAIREGEGFEQTVALKLLRSTFVDPRMAQRLGEERRLLARLEHPGIARLIDGGVTGDGHPFYAMEYVQGEELLDYCDTRLLDVPTRIRLFLQICDAVHHAHRQLVVHRDLKPSNILVTPEGRPKLLDFGIAKSLEDSSDGHPTAPWITPAYASPEQVTGGHVSTSSDVYSLGVLLCELLGGGRPYEAIASTPAELGRVIAETTPKRPSEVVRSRTTIDRAVDRHRPDAEEIARRRRTSPSRLARVLEGEVDLIVLKALAKEPERRYDSAWALAEELRRHLDGRPIEARADSLGYRVQKFVRRHRAATAISAALVAVLFVGTTGIVWQAREAVAERDRAEGEAARARSVTALMTDIFRLGDPTQTLGDTIGVRRVLLEGVQRVEATLGEDPVLQATLLMELGRIYQNLGILDEAERLARRVTDLRAEYERGTVAHADALGFLGLVLRDRGELDVAVERIREALELRSEVLSAPDTTTASWMSALAFELRSAGDHDGALALFEEALATQRDLLGDEDPAVATTLLGLAATLHDQGSFDEAEAILLSALDRGAADRPDPVAVAALVNVGMVRRIRGQNAEAQPLLERARAMSIQLYGPDHPGSIEAGEQLGANLSALGRFDEAEVLLEDLLGASIAQLGESHARTRNVREALASANYYLGHYDIAAARGDSVIEAKEAAHDGDHPGIVYSLVAQGDAYLGAGRLDRAESAYAGALAMGERLGGTEGVYGALARLGLADVELARGRVGPAGDLLARAETLANANLDPGHRYLRDLARSKARLLLARGQAQEAARILNEMIPLEEGRVPSPHPRLGWALTLLGEARAALGDAPGAQAAWERAATEFSGLPPSHPDRLRLDRLRAEADG